MGDLLFSWIDYTLFVLMFLISSALGVYYGFFVKQQKTTAAYLLGNKDLNYFPVAMSLAASMISSVSLMAFPTEVYLFGGVYMIGLIGEILVAVIVYYSFLPVFWKLEITTAYEYIELRFNKKLRSLASLLFTLTHLIHMSFIIYAPSLAFSQVTGFNVYATATIMCAVCIFYTTVGGLKAIVWVDTVQLIVILLTLGCVFVIGIVSVGGFQAIWDKAKIGDRLEFFKMDIDPTVRLAFWSSIIGTLATFTSYLGTNPYTVQRFLAVQNLKESRKALVVFIIIYIILQGVLCFCGIIIYAKYYDCDPLSAGRIKRADQILPYYILDVARGIPGLSGLFISGLFSASLSTLSTVLNSLSGLVFDLISPLMPSNVTDQYINYLLKIITVTLGILAFSLIFVITRLGTILELLTSFHAVSLAPILGIFMLGMLVPFSNIKGTSCGAIVCIIYLVFYTIKRQMYVWNGAIKYPKKPLYTDGCNLTSIRNSSLITMEATVNEPSEVSWLFRLSFLYVIPMGCILTLVIGLLVSWFTRDKEVSVDPNTLSPCVRNFLRKFRSPIHDEDVSGSSDHESCVKYTFTR